MSPNFGTAFSKLETAAQRGILRALVERQKLYTRAMRGECVNPRVILLADTPGPGRPTDPSYHHTPFYSTKHSSLWINRLLWEHRVPESALLWFNTTLADGTPLSHRLFFNQVKSHPTVICLGGNAEKWLKTFALYQGHYEKVFHPQAWKRFHSKEPYPLLAVLQHALDL
jgi:hypothetical protein